MDLECRYIRTHTKKKPSKISNITFAILPFNQEKMLKLNGRPEYFGIYYSWWNHQMRCKRVHFSIKTQNIEVVNLKLCNSGTTHSFVLTSYCTSPLNMLTFYMYFSSFFSTDTLNNMLITTWMLTLLEEMAIKVTSRPNDPLRGVEWVHGLFLFPLVLEKM